MIEEYTAPVYMAFHKPTRSIVDVHVIDFRHGVVGHDSISVEGDVIFKSVADSCDLMRYTGLDTKKVVGQRYLEPIYESYVLQTPDNAFDWTVLWKHNQGAWMVDNGLPLAQELLSTFLSRNPKAYVVGNIYQEEHEREDVDSNS